MRFNLIVCTVYLISLINGDEEHNDHCRSECTDEDLTYYRQSQPSADVGKCGESCENSESNATGVFADFCKCCSGLTRPQCVSQGANSQCGWAFHEGCGYCADWGGPQTCGSVNFDWEDDEDHCDPNGVSDLKSCKLDFEHQTSVSDDECDSHCESQIGECTRSTGLNCPTLFESLKEYMDERLNLEVADGTSFDGKYNEWKATITAGIGDQDQTLLDGIVSCVKEKCLGLTSYDVREALNGVYKNLVMLAWIIALFMIVVIM